MFKQLFDGIKDKDKSVHEAHYLRMQIMTLKERLKKHFESMSFKFV